jgi:predicted Rossmann-fold nucleotide-binding protein
MEYHMDIRRKKPIIGVMGSAQETLPEADRGHLTVVAESLGRAIVDEECILITGETTGLPELVAQAVRRHGGFTVGISPAHSFEEHQERYGLPRQGSDVVSIPALVTRDGTSLIFGRRILW